jgi:predicted DNA-binding protein
MTLTLHLTPEMEARLRELSQSTGRMPEELALDLLERDLEVEDDGPAVSYEEWSKHFDSWVKEQRSRNPHVDDSRDSIYPDRV